MREEEEEEGVREKEVRGRTHTGDALVEVLFRSPLKRSYMYTSHYDHCHYQMIGRGLPCFIRVLKPLYMHDIER